MDNRRSRSLLLACFLIVSVLGVRPSAAQAIADPILRSGLTAELVDIARLPASANSQALARLNLLIAAPDDSGRLFVNDMRGSLWILRAGVVDPTPFLDVAALFGANLDTASLQTGLSTFAFHPGFATPGGAGEGKLYSATSESTSPGKPDFTHTFETTTHYDVLSEWTVDASNPETIDPATRRVLMRIAEPHRDHNMGQIAFDPNAVPDDPDYGMLYIAMGDGGGYNANLGGQIDPHGTAQDRTNPFGSILRIDPLGTSAAGGSYGIPTDNPFVDNTSGILEEIWAFGFRNPHRFSWDTGGSGTMFVSDIGQVASTNPL